MFIFTYLLWIVITAIIMKKAMPHLIEGRYFWFTQILIVSQNVFFFLFIYLISGFFNLKLIGLFFIVAEIGVVLSSIIVGFIGALKTQWAAHGAWAGGEFGLKNQWIMVIVMLISFTTIIMYPIMIYKIPAEELLTRSIQYTSILYFSGYIVLAPVLIGALKSENLDEDTRKRYFSAQLSGLIPTALFLSLLFWSLGMSKAGIELPQIAGITFFLSPTLLIILFLFFFFIIILPYLIGAIRAKKWIIELLENRNKYLTKTLDILDFPDSSNYIDQLIALNLEIENEINNLPENDKMIFYGNRIDQDVIDKEVVSLAPAYRLSRDMDPRFNYLDWLHNFSERITQIINDLNSSVTDVEKRKKAKAWSTPLHNSQLDSNNEIEAARKVKGPILITSGISLVMLIVSAVLSDFGKWIFEKIVK